MTESYTNIYQFSLTLLMSMRYWTYALMGILLGSGILATKAAYAQGEWYPGDGAQEGLLMKYRIAFFDYKKSQPIDVTILLESRDEKDNWKAFTIVEDEGKVVTEELLLASLTLEPIGSISEEFRPYAGVIDQTLAWLSSYASKINPKALTGFENWGVIAGLGGGGIIVHPVGSETIDAAGKSWDTSLVGFHYAVDSTFWISDNFPFPVKAKVFALVSQHPIPVLFEYELLETRITDTPPEPPEAKLVVPKPPLSKHTNSATFVVDLSWNPETMEPGQTVQLEVTITDTRGKTLPNPRYDLEITDAAGKVVYKVENTGQRIHEVTFESAGRVHVEVTYLGTFSLGGGISEAIIEKAEFDLVVVPEFPFGAAAIMVAVVAAMIVVTRLKKISLTKL